MRLITLLVKHSGETQNTITKVNLLNKVLGIVAGVLLIDHDVRHTGFQQVSLTFSVQARVFEFIIFCTQFYLLLLIGFNYLISFRLIGIFQCSLSSLFQVPYHRIFIMLFLELSSPDPILENISFQVLTAYCNMLHILRPAKATGFAFAW